MIFPGTPSHQNILKAISRHYENEHRVRAVTVFGSLARGNWDRYSDLDMDIVVRDDVVLDPIEEAKNFVSVLNAAGEKLSLVIPNGVDAVDIVLESLAQISIRYHTLKSTKYVIVEHLIKIAGDLDLEAIKMAGLANLSHEENSPEIALDQCFRYAVEIKTAIERQRFWMGVELMHRVRNLLIEIYALTSGGARSIQHFDQTTPSELTDLLSSTIPQADTLPQTFENLLNLLQHEIPRFSNGKIHLQPRHWMILGKLRESPAFPRES